MTRAVDPVAGHTADNGAPADADTAGARPHTAAHADVDDPNGRASRYGTSVERIRSFTGVAPERAFDHDKLRAGVRLLLEGLGVDPSDPTIAGTPERVARMFDEVFAGLLVDPSDVLDVLFEEGHDELVLIRDIPFASMCEHHLVPFIGQAHVGYIPNTSGQVTGLSKLARLVDLVAKRPNLQERITTQIADIVEDTLAPRGVIVVIEAEHLCMSMRGVRKPGAITVTSAVRGVMRDDPATRAEAMALAVGASGSSVR